MALALTHRRLTLLMAAAALLAFAGGAGMEPLQAILAGAGLLTALVWQPSPGLSARLERIWLPLAVLLVVRALIHIFVIRDDVVIPVVDLLFLLLVAEALRSLDAGNEPRLYSLSFALLLASTAYRPGLLFVLAFTAYVGLATVALMVGHLRRVAEAHGAKQIPVPRSFLALTAGLSGATLIFSALVFLTFPRVSQGWAGRGQAVATSLAGFADEVSLGSHGSRIYGNPRIVLRVGFPDSVPADLRDLRWRGRSYDHFDGVRWSRSSGMPPSLAPTAWYEQWGEDVIRQEIYGAPLDTRVLFALHPLRDVEPRSRIQPIFDNAGDFLYWGSASPVYTAWSIQGRPSPEALRAARGGFVPARDHYLQLPPLSTTVQALGDSLLAPYQNRYDQVQALLSWFQREFSYTLELPATAREATLEHFLLDRRAGHCEYFSTAMAILLRTRGIPTREVNGFLGGEWSEIGSYLAVTQNQAHAWVEVWFPGLGWVPFDPTPAGTGGATAVTSWLWPGRFLLDAFQHRWNRWVLDYSMESQLGLLQRTREAVSRGVHPRNPPGSSGEWPLPGGSLRWSLGLALAAVIGGALLRRRRTPSWAARIFLRLRASARKAGFPPHAFHSPLALVSHLEALHHPGAPAARTVVEGYLAHRFSGTPLDAGARPGMERALREARRALRKRPPPGAPLPGRDHCTEPPGPAASMHR
ncbi:MAG: transglutaminaseTgpA domain-containing protein [Longimicrobiales bacterium]